MHVKISQMHSTKKSFFVILSQQLSRRTGKPSTFIVACILIVIWAVSGPFFAYNDSWQLLINTTTSVVTFLMVFIIQSSQNRDTAAIQIKLDELIANLNGAREQLLDLENLDDEELDAIQKEYQQRADKARNES